MTPEETAKQIADLEAELADVLEEIEGLKTKLSEAEDKRDDLHVGLNAILDAN